MRIKCGSKSLSCYRVLAWLCWVKSDMENHGLNIATESSMRTHHVSSPKVLAYIQGFPGADTVVHDLDGRAQH